MSDSLAESTRPWSEAISDLEAWKKQRTSELAAERQESLAALPEASALLSAWRSGRQDAARTRDEAIAAAARRQVQEEAAAAEARSAAFAEADRKERAADTEAYWKRERAIEDAENAYRRAADASHDAHGTSEDYLRERRAAERIRDEAVEKAKQEYDRKCEDFTHSRYAALAAAERQEYSARVGAQRRHEVTVANSVTAYSATIASLERQMREGLAHLPEAQQIESEYQRRLAELEREYKAREDAIFATLRESLS